MQQHKRLKAPGCGGRRRLWQQEAVAAQHDKATSLQYRRATAAGATHFVDILPQPRGQGCPVPVAVAAAIAATGSWSLLLLNALLRPRHYCCCCCCCHAASSGSVRAARARRRRCDRRSCCCGLAALWLLLLQGVQLPELLLGTAAADAAPRVGAAGQHACSAAASGAQHAHLVRSALCRSTAALTLAAVCVLAAAAGGAGGRRRPPLLLGRQLWPGSKTQPRQHLGGFLAVLQDEAAKCQLLVIRIPDRNSLASYRGSSRT